MKTQFQHECDGCRFLGQGKLGDTLCDWYVCGTKDRSIIARYGSAPEEYKSTGIGDAVEPTLIELQAVAYGFRFTPEEQKTYDERRLNAERGMNRDAFQYRKARVWDGPKHFEAMLDLFALFDGEVEYNRRTYGATWKKSNERLQKLADSSDLMRPHVEAFFRKRLPHLEQPT